MEKFKERIGRNIKMLRRNSGLTGEEFAESLNISRSHLHRLENAKAYGIVFMALYNLGKKTDLDRLFREDIEKLITERNNKTLYQRKETKKWIEE